MDSSFSLEPEEFSQLVIETERACQAMGRIQYGPLNVEKSSIQFRRSLYVVREIKAGDTFSSDNIRAIRPGYGLAPKYLELLLGKRLQKI